MSIASLLKRIGLPACGPSTFRRQRALTMAAMEALEQRKLLSVDLTFTGTAAADALYVRLHPDAQSFPDTIQVFAGHSAQGTPLHQLPRRDLGSFTIRGGGGDDTLTIDLTHGNPLRSGALRFAGGAGNDRIVLIGRPDARGAYLPNPSRWAAGLLVLGPRSFEFAGVEGIQATSFRAFTVVTPNPADQLSLAGGDGAAALVGTSGDVAFSPVTFTDTAKLVIDASSAELDAADDWLWVAPAAVADSSLNLVKVKAGEGSNTLAGADGVASTFEGTATTGEDGSAVFAGTAYIRPLVEEGGGGGQMMMSMSAIEVEISGDASVNEGATYTLAITNADHAVTKWLIDWGDGMEQVVLKSGGATTTAEHAFADDGLYEIVVTGENETDTFESNVLEVTVNNVAPSGVSISGRSTLIAGSAYRLDLSASDPGADGIGWEIDWGDGQSTNLSPSSYERPWVAGHVYAGAGPYLIQATALDEDGGRTQAGNTVIAGELAAPSNLSATAVSASQINLSWTDNSSGELGFRIDTSTDGSNYRTAAIAAPNATSYSLTALASGTLHYVRVSAFGAYGASNYASASATTSGDAIDAPQNLDYWHQSDFLLGMTWEGSPDAEFQVQARPLEYPHPAGGSDWMPMSGITMYDEWEEYWTWYGNMMHPSDHEYRVGAVDNGAYSGWVHLSVDGNAYNDVPGRPTGLAASSVTSSSFTVTWEPVEDAMYQVALVEPGSMRHPYSIAWSTGTVQYVYESPWQATFNDLQAGRTYQVVVVSISDTHGSFYANESAMLEVRTAPSPAGAPAAPSDLQVRPKDDLSGIELRWLDNSNNETGFTIARTGGGTAYFYPSANQISYLDTTAQPGVSYTYWVLARNAYGNSSWSNSAGATIVLPTVSIEADIAGASETPGNWGQFTIRREGGSLALRHALEVEYDVDLSGWPASGGTDYEDLPGAVTIPAGQTQTYIQVRPVEDQMIEWTEDVTLVVRQGQHYVPHGTAYSGAVEIVDNDPVNLIIQGLAEETEGPPDEMDPGALLPINDDDDNENSIPDNEETQASMDDDELEPVELYLQSQNKPNTTVMLSIDDGENFRVWKDDGTQLLGIFGGSGDPVLSVELDPETDGPVMTVYLEALAEASATLTLAAADAGATQPSTTQDSARTVAARNSINLIVMRLGEAQEADPGGTVVVNADNDNGSNVTNHVPALRDFDVTPEHDLAQRQGENDLRELRLMASRPEANETRRVRLSWQEGGRDRIRVWTSPTKTAGSLLTSPTTWALGQQPETLWVEGLREGESLRRITVRADLLDVNDQVLVWDDLKLTVTPVLTNLQVQIGDGTAPGLRQIAGAWYLESRAGGAPDIQTALFTSQVFALETLGTPKLVQNVHNVNSAGGGKGITYTDEMAPRTYDFAPPHAGATLLDATDGDMFYTQLQNYQTFQGTRTHTAKDSPLMALANALPNAGATGSLDVTLKFDLYAVWLYSDGSIWPLGKTEWSVHFKGNLIWIAGQLVFAPGGGNGNNPSTDFERDNSLPVTLGRPFANQGQAAWRED